MCRGRWRWGLALSLAALLALNLRLHLLLPEPPTPPPPVEPALARPQLLQVLETLQLRLQPRSSPRNLTSLWQAAAQWSGDKQVFAIQSPIGDVLDALRNAKIIFADNSGKGTQLKLHLKLEGGQSVFFKPQWYNRDHVVRGSVYSGKDRHNSEVLAFYLSALLDIRWAPLAIIRRVNIKTDVWENATPELKETMFLTDNGTVCLYGKCFYCKKNETVCGNKQDEMEGAMILLVKQKFNKYRSPWQRTYDVQRQADWESNPNYCSKVKKSLNTVRILDLIDVSIFDFLLQNGDRHHYETVMNRVIFLDNGKGLGNPHKDFNDILAPLYQCCMIRHSTWKRLKLLSGGYLSSSLSMLLEHELHAPVVTDIHLKAMDRRLHIIYSVVQTCIDQFGKSIFKGK